MLKIRLQRVGRKHEPAFRLVLTDSKNSTKSGRFKEILGSYDPRKSMDILKSDRIKHWLSVGAQPTDTVHNLLVSHKVIDGKKINVLPKKTAPVKEVPVAEATEVPVEEVPVADVSPEAPAPIPEAPAEAPVAETPTEEGPTEEIPASGTETETSSPDDSRDTA